MEVVRAEGNTNPNLVTVTKVELLNNGSTEVSPGGLRFAISGRAREDDAVWEIALIFKGADGQKLELVYKYEDSTSFWKPGTEGSTKSFSVTLPDNTGNQKYELDTVRLVSEGVFPAYTFYDRESDDNGYTNLFQGNLMNETEYEPIQFIYDGRADFTVRGSQASDTVAPIIQSLERIAPADGEQITPQTPITYRVNYVEEGSGLKNVQVAFKAGASWDSINSDFPNAYKGELTLTSRGRSLGDYKIEYIDIEDHSDNHVRYFWKIINGTETFGYEDYSLPNTEFVPVGDNFFVNDIETYSVVLPFYEGLKVTSVNMEADEDPNVDGKQLHAGQTYMAHVTVKNDGTQIANVDPTRLRVEWCGFGYGGSRELDAYGVGDKLTLGSGESASIQVPFTVNQYWPAVDLPLSSIYLNYNEEEYSWDMVYTADNQYFSGYNSEHKWVDTLHNTACSADFTVIPGEHMDMEAPVLGSLFATSESFKAPGRATFQMTMSGVEGAKLEYVMMMVFVSY